MTAQDTFDSLKYRIEVDEYDTRRYYNAANQLHRTDGPAVEYDSGHREWWVNGKLHRTNGPAVVWARQHKEWYVNGVEYTEEEFKAAVKK